jgi:hypothetical protein
MLLNTFLCVLGSGHVVGLVSVDDGLLLATTQGLYHASSANTGSWHVVDNKPGDYVLETVSQELPFNRVDCSWTITLDRNSKTICEFFPSNHTCIEMKTSDGKTFLDQFQLNVNQIQLLSAVGETMDCSIRQVLIQVSSQYRFLEYNTSSRSWKTKSILPSAVAHGKKGDPN